jgi:uncharacterized protein YcfL
MKSLLLLSVIILVGCSSARKTPNTALIVEKETEPMTRAEIISAAHECESANMKSIMITAKRRINNHVVPVTVDVTCVPKMGK